MHAPATARNRDPILQVLEKHLPPDGTILEIASGTGEHAVYMAPRLPNHFWLPSDIDSDRLDSIAAWARATPAPNLFPALRLDVRSPRWPVEETPPDPPVTAILAINLIHIAPWDVCLGLMAGAGRILPPSGVLYLYGPYKVDGQHSAPSNEAFDLKLRHENPSWGIRDLKAVQEAALDAGLVLRDVVEMPANNLSVVFTKPK
ncbi:MAG: DUF938 domain-containing protein [Alphaproteobacteria bacterium]|nr:MAG: DUF938 domain-containing protein [Alphaproteobacteria bacterium]